jgi:hypothetical protein
MGLIVRSLVKRDLFFSYRGILFARLRFILHRDCVPSARIVFICPRKKLSFDWYNYTSRNPSMLIQTTHRCGRAFNNACSFSTSCSCFCTEREISPSSLAISAFIPFFSASSSAYTISFCRSDIVSHNSSRSFCSSSSRFEVVSDNGSSSDFC